MRSCIVSIVEGLFGENVLCIQMGRHCLFYLALRGIRRIYTKLRMFFLYRKAASQTYPTLANQMQLSVVGD